MLPFYYIGKLLKCTETCRCTLIVLYLSVSFLSSGDAQFVSRDNYTGDWNNIDSWVGGLYPGTSLREEDVDCYGYLTSYYCIDFDIDQFRIHDTLVIYGSFSLLNKSRLTIDPGGILIVFGDYYSNNKAEVENSGYLIVTGQFQMQGSDNQGFFHNTGGKVFLFDSDPEIKAGSKYIDLACPDSSDFPDNCGYGNKWDLYEDPINNFFSGFNYSPAENDTLPSQCILISFEADRVELCQYDTVTFYDQTTGTSENSLYEWDFGEGAYPQVATGRGPHKVIYNSAGYKDVQLIVTDLYSVMTKRHAYINVAQAPDLVLEDTSRCGAGEILFNAISERADIVQFSTDGGATIFHQASSAPYTCPIILEEWGRITIWANAIDTSNGCMTGWDVTAMGYAYPLPDVNIIGDTIICENETLNFVTSEEFAHYLWNDGSVMNSYSTSEAEQVFVTVWNEFGCQDPDSLSIEDCNQKDLFTTKFYSFSPNADGINDYWVLDDIELYPLAKISVYDSSGKRVFHSPGGYGNDWDGTFDGQRLPIDSYYYLIDLNNYNKGILIGIVTILYIN
jgi:gliding motility-associated-like protein